MTIKELMTSSVRACDADTNLATVAKMMWDGDCGAVPVVNEERRVIGMITDRDICIAAATRSASPSSLRVRDAMSGQLYVCAASDDVRAALSTMKERRVRRLPVLDQQGHLAGIISINDLVAEAELRKGAEVPGEELLETLKSISAHSPAMALA
jgi:CBS domain-containing protein